MSATSPVYLRLRKDCGSAAQAVIRPSTRLHLDTFGRKRGVINLGHEIGAGWEFKN
jgi:hypothetical protein